MQYLLKIQLSPDKKLSALLPSCPHNVLHPFVHRAYSYEGNHEGSMRVRRYSHSVSSARFVASGKNNGKKDVYPFAFYAESQRFVVLKHLVCQRLTMVGRRQPVRSRSWASGRWPPAVRRWRHCQGGSCWGQCRQTDPRSA